jgi:hypothetical protein
MIDVEHADSWFLPLSATFFLAMRLTGSRMESTLARRCNPLHGWRANETAQRADCVFATRRRRKTRWRGFEMVPSAPLAFGG